MGKRYSADKPGIADYHRKMGLVDDFELKIAEGIQGLGASLKGLVKKPGYLSFVYGNDQEKAVFTLKTEKNKNGTTRVFTLLMPEKDIASMMGSKEGDEAAIEKVSSLVSRAKTFVETHGIDYVAPDNGGNKGHGYNRFRNRAV